MQVLSESKTIASDAHQLRTALSASTLGFTQELSYSTEVALTSRWHSAEPQWLSWQRLSYKGQQAMKEQQTVAAPGGGWKRWALLGAGVLLALSAARLFSRGEGSDRVHNRGTAALTRSSDPTVLCADGTRSNILTRAAQEDACASHGGIKQLLVPPYRPARAARPPARPAARKLSQTRPALPSSQAPKKVPGQPRSSNARISTRRPSTAASSASDTR